MANKKKPTKVNKRLDELETIIKQQQKQLLKSVKIINEYADLVKTVKKETPKCQTLGCLNAETEPHTCLFAVEINGKMDLCNCCDDCAHQCAMDI